VVVAIVCAVTLLSGFGPGLTAGVLQSVLVFMPNVNRSLLRDRHTADQRPSRHIYRPERDAVCVVRAAK
jgi:hypothetical protein